MHFVIAVLVIKTDFIDKIKLKLGLSNTEISEFYLEMAHYHKRIDQSLLPNSILFIGDSHIQSLYVQMEGLRSANFGIGNDTTIGVRKRLSDYQALSTAQAVVLQIGINDLEYRSVQQTLESYEQLLKQLPKNSNILLNAVFPVSETIIADGRQWNLEVSQLNIGLRALCNDIDQCRFLNVGNTFLDGNGDLSERFHLGDGVHLNKLANEIWRTEMHQELMQLM